MAFDLHISIPDTSPAVEAVQRVAQAERITPGQAATRLLEEAAQRHGAKTPAEEMLGAFSSPEDLEIFDRAMESAKAHRAQYDQLRDFGFGA